MKTNIVKQLKECHVFLNDSILLVDIKEINVPNLEQTTKINVELKVRGDVKSVINPLANPKLLELKVKGTLENDQGETVQVRWSFVGKTLQVPNEFGEMRTFTINVHSCEHHIDGEEQYFIDIPKHIHRIDGVDRLAAIRDAIGI